MLDREIEVPLTSDVDGALGEVAVDGSAVLDSRYKRRIDGNANGWEVHRNVALIGGCLCLLKLGEPRKKLGNISAPERMGRTGWGTWRAIGRMREIQCVRYGERMKNWAEDGGRGV